MLATVLPLSPIRRGHYNRSEMAVIEIRGLEKTYRVYQKQEGLLAAVRGLFNREYREVQAVRGIDLDVAEGEFVAFLGPNGAGKTTSAKRTCSDTYPRNGTAIS